MIRSVKKLEVKNMNDNLFEKIADFIIKEVQENSESSMSGF